ncbi:MAG: hypothetical protein C5B50_08040 [Verrucomicrobia bacterium]|nr:MAG: hypothetical protein C5B50_08040 [Verrucomicrobiota bacterium]
MSQVQLTELMKTTSKLWVSLVAGMLGFSALAADQTKDAKSAKPTTTADKAKAAKAEAADKNGTVREPLTTGSHIPRKVKRAGVITDGTSQVVVLDRKAIEESGAADAQQLLIHRGIR